MKKQNYSVVALCGLDECGCVGATAKGAVRTGVHVMMLKDCIGRRFPMKTVLKKRETLIGMGIEIV